MSQLPSGDSDSSTLSKPRRSASKTTKCPLIAVALHHIIADVRRRPLSFVLVVLFTAVLAAAVSTLSIALSQASLIFLRFAEHRTGETDIIALPENALLVTNDAYVVRSPIVIHNLLSTSALKGINFTRVLNAFGNSTEVCGNRSRLANAAPRWVSSGYVSSTKNSRNATSVPSYLLAFDTNLEKESGIGRSWDRRKGGKLEGYLSSAVR